MNLTRPDSPSGSVCSLEPSTTMLKAAAVELPSDCDDGSASEGSTCSDDPVSPKKPKAKKAKKAKDTPVDLIIGRTLPKAMLHWQAFMAQLANSGTGSTPAPIGVAGAATKATPSSPEGSKVRTVASSLRFGSRPPLHAFCSAGRHRDEPACERDCGPPRLPASETRGRGDSRGQLPAAGPDEEVQQQHDCGRQEGKSSTYSPLIDACVH